MADSWIRLLIGFFTSRVRYNHLGLAKLTGSTQAAQIALTAY